MNLLHYIKEDFKHRGFLPSAFDQLFVLLKQYKIIIRGPEDLENLENALKENLNDVENRLPVKIETVSYKPTNSLRMGTRYIKEIKSYYYKNRIDDSEIDKIEGDKLFDDKETIEKQISFVNQVILIADQWQIGFDSQEKVQIKTEKKHKAKRDTRPKEDLFIESFVKNSGKYLMTTPKQTAGLNGVSLAWISTHYKRLDFVEKLYEALEKEYLLSKNSKGDKESNIISNFSYINEILESLKKGKDYVKAKSDIKELTDKEKRLGIKTDLKKILST